MVETAGVWQRVLVNLAGVFQGLALTPAPALSLAVQEERPYLLEYAEQWEEERRKKAEVGVAPLLVLFSPACWAAAARQGANHGGALFT